MRFPLKKESRLLKIFISLLLCLTGWNAYAGVFSVAAGDKSKEYLGTIFGGPFLDSPVLGYEESSVLALMMQKFNFAIVVLGSLCLAWTIIVATVNTAKEGEPLGKKMPVWAPIRAVFGILIVIPVSASGYSVIQMAVMWSVLSGIGLANSVWDVVFQQLAKGAQVTETDATIAMTGKITPVFMQTLSREVFRAAVCMKAINLAPDNTVGLPNVRDAMNGLRADAIFTNSGGVRETIDIRSQILPPKGDIATDAVVSQTAEINIGIPGARAPYNALCGKFLVTTVLHKDDLDVPFSPETLKSRLEIKVQAVKDMFTSVDAGATTLGNTPAAVPAGAVPPAARMPDKGQITKAGQAYINGIMKLIEPGKKHKKRIPLNYASLNAHGWIHAGGYYHTITQPTIMAKTDFEVTPETSIPTTAIRSPQELQDLLKQHDAPGAGSNSPTNIMNRILSKTEAFIASDTPKVEKDKSVIRAFNIHAARADLTLPGELSSKTHAIISIVKDSLLQNLTNVNLKDPIATLSKLGSALTNYTEDGLFNEIAEPLKDRGFARGSFINAIQYVILMTGATLGTYVPLIPYLIFFVASFGWFVSVTQAVILSPMVSLALCFPSEEGKAKALQGVYLCLGIFLRPTLMVIGLLASILLLRAGFSMLNVGFAAAINTSTIPTVSSILAILLIYTFVVMGLVNKAFSLIYALPNQVLQWIGAQGEQVDVTETMREVKSGFDSTLRVDPAQAMLGKNRTGGGELPQP